MPEDTVKAVVLFLLFLIALTLIIIFIIKHRSIAAFYIKKFSKGESFLPSIAVEAEDKRETPMPEPIYEAEAEEVKESESAAVIDIEYADNTISDSLAKDLIRKSEEVETEGRKKRIVNVDTLSRSFSGGARVDINLLKSKSLIPYDTGYIKVLARGIIDKPLSVYANDFSLSAVKMIALAGGKSIKVHSPQKFRISCKGNLRKGLEKEEKK